MVRFKRILFFLFFIFSLGTALLAGVSLFSFSRWAKSTDALTLPLVTLIEERSGARLSFQETKIIFTPFPLLQLRNLRLDSPLEEFTALAADQMRFPLRFFPLLFGRAVPSGVSVRGGKGLFGRIPLEGIEFKLNGLSPGRQVSFQAKANTEGGKGIVKGKGTLIFQNRGENFWKELRLQADLKCHPFSVSEIVPKDFWRVLPETLRPGSLTGFLHLEKGKGLGSLEGEGRFQMNPLQSKAPSLWRGGGNFSWNFEKGILELKRVSFKAPFGEVEAMGIYKGETGEIEEGRLRGRQLILEELVRNFPVLNSILPLGVGFSGESELDMSLWGTWDYLSLHANWNLTPSVLTYGNLFSKPKDFPLGFNFDFLLKGGSRLGGDFSVSIERTTVKGALAHFDLRTGTAELTLLTNKFDLAGWRKLLTPLADYELSGALKVLVNFKGNLTRLREAEKMVNLTLEDFTLLSKSGRGIREASLLVDSGPLSFRIKEGRFMMGGSAVQLEGEIYNLKEHPQGTFEILSPALDPFALIEHFKELNSLFPSLKPPFGWEELEKTIGRFLPRPALWEDFLLRLEVQEKKSILQDLRFRTLEGDLSFEGEFDRSSAEPRFSLQAQLERVSLARYFEGRGEIKKILEGNLFFKGKFQGEGSRPEEAAKTLAGEGSLLVTNGEWPSLDLAGPLQELEPFQKLSVPPSHSTPFSDLKASWHYRAGKFETNDFLIRSEDFWVEGKGNLSAEGVLNSRLEVYLSKELTQHAFDSWQARERTEGKQLGPVPFLLLGSLAEPQAKVEERESEAFLAAIRNRKFQKVLHEPFEESRQST